MHSLFARRTAWDLAINRYTQALEAHRRAGRELLDLTASNPTTVGLRYDEETLLRALASPDALRYEPQPKGLLCAREAVAGYYAEHGASLSPDDLILTTSTSEGYSFVFRLLCNPGDALLVPTPSYPLFDFLADIQDVKLFPYELVYDHGWQIDFTSLRAALQRAQSAGARCPALLLVHPNNPTGSYVKPHEREQLNDFCHRKEMAIIADEVFLDYPRSGQTTPTFASNQAVLTFTLSGLSKISALPQMKIAWIALGGPPALQHEAVARMEVIADTFLSMNAPVQLAVPAMMNQRHSIRAQLRERVRQNLSELDSQLAAKPACRRLELEGGWYVVLRVPAIVADEELTITLLQQSGVLVQPGHFYDFAGNGHLIVSLITEPATFATGIRRMLDKIGSP